MKGNVVIKSNVKSGVPISTNGNEAVMPSNFICVQRRVDNGKGGGILFSLLSSATGHDNCIKNGIDIDLTGSTSIRMDPMRNALFPPSSVSGTIEYEIMKNNYINNNNNNNNDIAIII